jgi:hypothetical protein
MTASLVCSNKNDSKEGKFNQQNYAIPGSHIIHPPSIIIASFIIRSKYLSIMQSREEARLKPSWILIF